MKKSIYLYLQRYLLKVLTKPCTFENYNNVFAPHLLNMVKTQKSVDLLTLNFFKNHYIKKSVGFNSDFSVLSSSDLINQTYFLKKSQKHDFSFFRFVKNNNLTYLNTIECTPLLKGTKYKKNFDVNFGSSTLFNFLKIKKNAKMVSNFMLYHGQVIFFYFQKKNKKNLLIFFTSFQIKQNSLIFLQSVFFFSSFFSQHLSLNKQSEMVYLNKLCCTPFSIKPYAKNFRLSTDGFVLCDKIFIFVDSLFLVIFKYVKKKKLIHIITSKVFVDLVNKFNLYWFHKKNPTIIQNNCFESQTVLITTAVNSYIFFLRPLFSLTRLDTFYICESLKLPIYPDQSNFRVDFLRNRIRKQILPAIRILLNPQFDTLLCKFNDFSN